MSQVYKNEELEEKAVEMAEKIASYSRPVVAIAKETVNLANNVGLDQGVKQEKRNFHATFALEDRREGMTAFAEKRKPEWKHK